MMDSKEMVLVYALIGVMFFAFRNPDRKYIYPISVSAFGLFISEFIYFYIDIPAQIIWIISALGFLSFYFLRFKNKTPKTLIEYLKIPGATLLAIYPIPFHSLVHVGEGDFWTVTRMMTPYILTIIYFYDRWILNPEKMKKKYIVVLTAQSILILLMLMYAFVQRSEANKQREVAEKQRILAIENEKKATETIKKYEKLLAKTAAHDQ